MPFVKYGGLRFLDAAHVKDVLAVLRWAENPRDRVAGLRVLKLLPGVGHQTAVRPLDCVVARADVAGGLQDQPPPSRGQAAWGRFLALMTALRCATAIWPRDISLVVAWYAVHLGRLYDDAPARQADLDQLTQIAAVHPSRRQFLTELTLDPPAAISGESGAPARDEDYLTLSTIHSAKGQEWRAVYLLNAVDGCLPSDMATGRQDEIEEERRLLYVAMTRARDHLQIVVPQRFFVTHQAARGDRHVYAGRTRFIPESLLGLFDVVAWPPAPVADAPPDPGTGAVVAGMRARIRSLLERGGA